MDQTQQWVGAYLEWIDVSSTELSVSVRQTFTERRTSDRRLQSTSRSRENALLLALRAEADCVRVLRDALERSGHYLGGVH
jgi:hypothetical protein